MGDLGKAVGGQALGKIFTDKTSEYGQDPKYDQNGRAFVLDKAGNVKYLDRVTQQDEFTYVDRGGSQVRINKRTGQPMDEIGKTAAPVNKPLTFDNAKTVLLDGKPASAMQGSDGNWYAPGGEKLDPTKVKLLDENKDPSVPSGYRWNEDRTQLIPVPGGPADPAKKAPTESQATATLYHTMASEGNKALEALDGDYSATGWTGLKDKMFTQSDWLNWAASEKGQQFQQAAKQFASAVLRKESGAAIPDSEWKNVRERFIPQPGDSPGVLAQKKAARADAIAAIKVGADPFTYRVNTAGGAGPTDSGPAQSEIDELFPVRK
jgi:hypothetical protein